MHISDFTMTLSDHRGLWMSNIDLRQPLVPHSGDLLWFNLQRLSIPLVTLHAFSQFMEMLSDRRVYPHLAVLNLRVFAGHSVNHKKFMEVVRVFGSFAASFLKTRGHSLSVQLDHDCYAVRESLPTSVGDALYIMTYVRFLDNFARKLNEPCDGYLEWSESSVTTVCDESRQQPMLKEIVGNYSPAWITSYGQITESLYTINQVYASVGTENQLVLNLPNLPEPAAAKLRAFVHFMTEPQVLTDWGHFVFPARL